MKEINLKALYKGNFYHVCTDGLEQVTLLKDEEDFKVAWNYLALSAWRTGVEVVTFTLMSNHVHELLACQDECQADKAIKLFKKLLSTFLRRKYGLSQILHETTDCISLIDTEQYMKNCIAYILRNAVCARICSKLGFTQKRNLLRTGMNLNSCPYELDETGLIILESFVRSDIVEKVYRNSGKSFLI